MAQPERTRRRDEWKALLAEDREFLKGVVQGAMQEVLEAEMTEALQAGKHERTEARLCSRARRQQQPLPNKSDSARRRGWRTMPGIVPRQ